MGLFNFRKRKSNFLKGFEPVVNSMFPKGKKDIDAGTSELLLILNNEIDFETAQTIFVRSYAIKKLSEKFDKERLMEHLSGYCIQHFSDSQIERFHTYLVILDIAKNLNGVTPSEVKRDGDKYAW